MLDRCLGNQDSLPTAELKVGKSGLGLPLRLVQAAMRARRFLRRNRVDLVVGAGGRTTVPAALAARSLGVPVCLLEQNVVTGRANRMLRPLAQRIYLGLPPNRPLRNGIVTGTPLRSTVGQVEKKRARRGLGLRPEGLVVMVTGGSQGARVLNQLVPEALAAVASSRPQETRDVGGLQVVHLSGAGAEVDVRQRYADVRNIAAMVRPVIMDIASLYAAADLVICRGGGGTVAELMVVGRPSIIVPYPHHKDRQQWHNGRVLEAAGAAIVCDEVDLSVHSLTALIDRLLDDPSQLAAMGARARAIAPLDPCTRILDDLKQMGVLD